VKLQAQQALPEPKPVSAAGLPCVLRGTLIATQRGEIPVEDLQAGDRVVSRDRGLATVRWIGILEVDSHLTSEEAPVKIPRGALGRNVPIRDLYVAPDQRLWLRGAAFKDLFASHEVLIPARHLVGWHGISQVTYVPDAEYHLVLFDQSEIIVADGLQVESVHPGGSLDAFACTARDAMIALFPELTHLAGAGGAPRRRLDRTEAKSAMASHRRH
jgi:hypothetical protein